ncbi:polyisoprenoid-binding protein [bacterium]|nr:MAG: polyisoprenoid-binding protein [bacterium]
MLKQPCVLRKIVCAIAIIGVLSWGLSGLTAVFAADQYIIDPGHSTIGFAVSHMDVSIVRGEFTDYAGEILFDEKDVNSMRGEITIKAKSIDTRLKARDDHLKSQDFFDVEKYPEIVFKGKKITKTPSGYEITGDLTLHGITREVSGPAVIRGPVMTSYGKQLIGISGETVINRRDFGISWSVQTPGGGLAVGNDVKIIIDVEAYKK